MRLTNKVSASIILIRRDPSVNVVLGHESYWGSLFNIEDYLQSILITQIAGRSEWITRGSVDEKS